MNKKITALATVAAMICASASAFASTFSDVDDTQYAWCVEQIENMAKVGYVHGYEDGTFRPDNEITKLEGIALFSRAMGSENEANEAILALAHEQYDSALKTCSLAWGSDELAYMLYKGAFTASDLTTYVAGTAKNEQLTRGEAAVIITKAMGGESEATSTTSVSLTYNDSNSIPTNILQYVKYVTDKGIMNGIDDEFRAGDTVTRAQIAVMLNRVSDKCDYSFAAGKFISMDEENGTVTLNIDGETVTASYTESTSFTLKGDYIDAKDIASTASVVAQFSGDELVMLDCISNTADETITGVYAGYGTLGKVIQVKIKETESSTNVKTYTCVEDVPVTYKGSPATIKSLSTGDSVILEMADGKVQSITAEEKSTTITNAKVAAINVDGDEVTMTISSSNDKYDGQTYKVSDTVSVKKNGNSSDLASIYVGDTVTLTLKYGVLSAIAATSTSSSKTGTIVSITIAAQPSITVNIDGKETTYQVPQDCAITVNQAEGSIYDFRVGDNVALTVESDAVTKIKVSTAVVNQTGSVSGTVLAVNTSYGFISVQTEDSTVPYNVFKTANGTTVITSVGKSLDFKSIKVGDTVECKGTTTNGAFIATLILVTQAN